MMKSILTQLHYEYTRPIGTLGRKSMARAKLVEAVLLFLRGMWTNPLASDQVKSTGERSGTFWSIVQHVHIHYMDKLTLESVAKNFFVSTAYVSRLFKEFAGQSFLQYVHQLRVNSAAHMLASTNMTVAEITFATGFESFRTFARVFKKMKGQTPTEYRTRNYIS